MFDQRGSLLLFYFFIISYCRLSCSFLLGCFIGFCPLLCPRLRFRLLIVTYALPILRLSLSPLFLDHSSTSVVINCYLSKPPPFWKLYIYSFPPIVFDGEARSLGQRFPSATPSKSSSKRVSFWCSIV
jgi:hypothetical protein